MVTVRWGEKNRRPPWGSWHSFEWNRSTQEMGAGAGGRHQRDTNAGVQGAKVLWSSRERAFGPSPVSRYKVHHPALVPFPHCALTALRRCARADWPERCLLSPAHSPPAPTNHCQAGTLQSQSSARFVSFGEGVGPQISTHVGRCTRTVEAAVVFR